MIISITLPDLTSSTSNSNPKLPPTLAKISHDEIVLIELQGALDVGDMHPSERNGKFVGKLSVDDGLKRATLLIGHHLLEGKIAPIPKPLAIMHRVTTSTATNPPRGPSNKSKKKRARKEADSIGAMDVDSGENQEDDEEDDMEADEDDMEEHQEDDSQMPAPGTDAQPATTSQWTIIGLVKKKIIFSKRPMPVIKR